MRCLMGIDNGGTYSKVAIFNKSGKQLSVASLPTTMLTPYPGHTERDMEELWQVNVETIKLALERAGLTGKDIAGISFSGHGKGLYLVGEEGSFPHNGIVSTDTRAYREVEDWYENKTNEKVFQKTYQEILACQPVSLLAWLKKNKPKVLEKTKHIFAVKDYIRYRMTGEAYAEYTDFSGGNLINMETGTYDRELLALFGIEEVYDKLPPLKHSFDVCGYVTKEVAKLTGLKAGTPVMAGMFDVNACGLGSGLINEEELCMIAGTWSINEFIAKKPVTDGSVALNSMYCIPGYYLIEESSPTSAGNLEWFIRNLLGYEKKEMEEEGKSIYDLTNAWVKELDEEESNLIYLPFLNGSGEEPLAKGSFIGLTGYHNKKHMVRAVYEGVVFSHLTHLQKLLQNRQPPQSIRLSGGLVRSDVWVDMFADALQIPIDVLEDREVGAAGAAIAAGIGAGIYASYEEAVKKTVKITKTVIPSRERASFYTLKYRAYMELVKALKNAWYYLRD